MYVKSETSPDAPMTVYLPTGCTGAGETETLGHDREGLHVQRGHRAEEHFTRLDAFY